MKMRKVVLGVFAAMIVGSCMNVMAQDVTESEHVYMEPEFKWYDTDEGYICYAITKCTSCNDMHEETLQCKVEEVYKKATCTEDGKRTRTASIEINGRVYTDQIVNEYAAKGHKFDDTECERCDEVRNPASVIKIAKERTVTYSGNTYVLKVQEVKGSTGKITYNYYLDKKCTVLTTSKNAGAKREGGAPKEPGQYYVIATVAADDNYRETVTEPSKLTIRPRKVKTLKAVNVEKGVKLTWSKCEEADGYIIYSKKSLNAKGWAKTVIDNNKTTSFTYKEGNGDYAWRTYYNVVAYSNVYGSKKNVVESYMQDKNVQIIHYHLDITNQKNGVKLKWKKSNATDVKGYYIYRKRAGESKFTKAKTITNPKTVTWTDTSSKTVVNGKKVQYYIKAYYGKSNSVVTKSVAYTNYYLGRPEVYKSGGYLKWDKISKASGYQYSWYLYDFGEHYVWLSNKETKRKLYHDLTEIKVRAYINKNGKKYYSAWSNTILDL